MTPQSLSKLQYQAARPSTVKAELLQPQSWQNSPCLMGTVSLPMSDGMNEGPERSYSLHQSQSPGRRKRRTGNLRTERRSHVTWGSSKRRKAHDDGGTIVLKCSGQCLRHGEGFQRVRSFQAQGQPLRTLTPAACSTKAGVSRSVA